MNYRTATLGLLAALWWGGACRPPPPGPLDDLPPAPAAAPDPARLPSSPAQVPETLGLRQILVGYRGAFQPFLRYRWTRDQARERAERLLALCRAPKSDFAALAQKYSDDTDTSGAGGELGLVLRGDLHPDLEQAAFGLELGQVSAVIETPRGFHILQRIPPNQAQAAEIVVTFDGAQRLVPRTPRSLEEARRLAGEVLSRLRAGESFEREARAHSDLANHEQGGILPIFRRGSLHPQFEEIVWGLAEGETSEVVETSTGFHIVRRLVPRRVEVRLIQLPFAEDDRVAEVTEELGKRPRSRSEARALIERLAVEARRPGADFAALAALHSEGNGATDGGLQKPFTRGENKPAIEQAAFGVSVGAVADPFDADGAYFLLKRTR